MSKLKNSRITHFNLLNRSLSSKPVEDEGWNEDSLDSPETLEEFERAVLELFSPGQHKSIRLN